MNNNNTNFEYKQINSKFLISDNAYQRTVDMKRVKRIVAKFNENLVNPIKVSYRDGKFYVFDGQHTLAALKLRNNNNDLLVDCKLYKGLTQQEEAELFSEQTGIARIVETNAKFKALYVAGNIEVCEFKELTEKAGIRMDFSKGKAANKIIACREAFNIYKKTTSREYVEILSMIKNTWDGSAESYNREILGGVFIFYQKYKGEFNIKIFEKQLAKVSPIFIIREGKLSLSAGNEKYAKKIYEIYNKNLRSNKLEYRF